MDVTDQRLSVVEKCNYNICTVGEPDFGMNVLVTPLVLHVSRGDGNRLALGDAYARLTLFHKKYIHCL